MSAADCAAAAAPLAGGKGALFESQAEKYAKYRPTYPKSLYSAILEFGGDGLKGGEKRRLAVDVATGSGQVATVLADLFKRVIACDSSKGQLSHAVQRPNIDYVLAPAEQLPEAVPAGMVDLVTCAQAMHWFDIPRFYSEMQRVLKPDGGTLAIWGYGVFRFSRPSARHIPPESLARANQLLMELYSGTLGSYWDEKRLLVDQKYEGLEPDASRFRTVQRQELVMEKEMSINAAVGYLSSWSAYAEHRRRHPDLEDPLVGFKQELMAALNVYGDEDAGAVLIETPLFLILAKDPLSSAVSA